jgi:non-homologous end joining protein Ku
MASRAYWKGRLRLSLVTVGVELHSAVKSSDEELGKTSNVIDLMDALRKSVAKRGGDTRTHTAATSPRCKPAQKSTRRHPAARKTAAKKRKAS